MVRHCRHQMTGERVTCQLVEALLEDLWERDYQQWLYNTTKEQMKIHGVSNMTDDAGRKAVIKDKMARHCRFWTRGEKVTCHFLQKAH